MIGHSTLCPALRRDSMISVVVGFAVIVLAVIGISEEQRALDFDVGAAIKRVSLDHRRDAVDLLFESARQAFLVADEIFVGAKRYSAVTRCVVSGIVHSRAFWGRDGPGVGGGATDRRPQTDSCCNFGGSAPSGRTALAIRRSIRSTCRRGEWCVTWLGVER